MSRSKKCALLIQRGICANWSSASGRGFDRVDANALLAGVAPLLLHIAAGDGGRRHDEDEEVHRIDGVGDLLPPSDSAFEEEAVLLHHDVAGFAGQALANLVGSKLAVGAGVGEEDSRH